MPFFPFKVETTGPELSPVLELEVQRVKDDYMARYLVGLIGSAHDSWFQGFNTMAGRPSPSGPRSTRA